MYCPSSIIPLSKAGGNKIVRRPERFACDTLLAAAAQQVRSPAVNSNAPEHSQQAINLLCKIKEEPGSLTRQALLSHREKIPFCILLNI